MKLMSLGCLAALALFSAVDTAHADEPARASGHGPITLPVKPVEWHYASAHETDIHGAMEVATTKTLRDGAVPVLSSFGLRFGNGDHELRRVGVIAKTKTTTVSLADQNNDDPFEASATWAVLDRGKTGSVSAVGGGVFEIPIPGDAPKGHTLVLSGFELRRQDKTDANVRAIGVWLDEDRDVARVTLVDDQGPEFAAFIAGMGKVILGVATMGIYTAVADSQSDAVKKLNDGKEIDGFRAYAVTVQYAWIPDSVVSEHGVMTGTGNKPSSGMKLTGDLGLTGFEMAFTNGDHHLREIAVQPLLTELGGAQPGGGEVRFEDVNDDDPKKWAVGFVRLK